MRSNLLPSELFDKLAASRHDARSTRTHRARPSGLPGSSGQVPCSRRSRCRWSTELSEVEAWWADHCSWNSCSQRSCAKPTGCFDPDCSSSEARGKSARSRSRGPRRSRARPRGASAAMASSERAVSVPSSVAQGSWRCRASASQRAPPSRSATPPSRPSRAARSVRSSRDTAPSMEPARSEASPPPARERRRSSKVSNSLLCTSNLDRSRVSSRPISGTGGMA
mmetsp:Transcript_102624/g.299388  ORF Transcript_102624/g.299388 Transcript_102624/m.299388 type:complete len:224 (+) Transcript_102624:839-1510(+)